MMKWNVNAIAVMVAGVLLGNAALADYVGPYNGAGFSSSLSQAQSILPSFAGSPANGDSFGDIAEQRRTEAAQLVDKLAKNAGLTEKEAANNAKLRDWNKRIENAQKLHDVFEIKGLTDTNAALNKSKQALALTQQISTVRGVSPQDIDTSSLGKECKNGVDFSQFQQMSNFLGSQPFQYFKSNYAKMVGDASEDLKKGFLEKLKKLKKTFAARAEKKPEDFQKNVQDLNANDVLGRAQNGEFTQEKRLKDQQKNLAITELRMNEAEQAINDELFDKIVPSLVEGAKNKGELEQLKSNFIQNLKDTLAVEHNTVFTSARQVEENCRKLARTIGTDSLAPGALTTTLYSTLASSPFLVNSANAMLQGFNYYRNNLNCTNATNNLDAMYSEGGSIGTAISALSGTQSPQDFLAGVNNVLNAMRDANSQVGGILKPAIDSCKHVEAEKEALEKKNQEAQQLVAQLNGQGQQPGAPGAQPSSSPSPGANQQARGGNGGQFGFGGRGGRRGGQAHL